MSTVGSLNDNFRCRHYEGGYCKYWLRACVSIENCSNNADFPCPVCAFASPLERPQCAECIHFVDKKENYIED